MSLKKVAQVKADKGFRIWDLIIYGVIIVLAVVSFVVIFTTSNRDPLSGVRIYVKGEVVFEYDFEGKPKKFSDVVNFEEKNGSITVFILADDGDYNEVYINVQAKTVKMADANCQNKDCLYFPVINNNSKFIYCSPHGVKIEPYVRDLDGNDIII